jgi:hypothetical protein
MSELSCPHPECSDSDKTFDTERGMKIHYGSKHDGSLAKKETECKKCVVEFEYYPSSKDGHYCECCSREIPWDWSYDRTGEEHHNWNRVCVTCSYCGDSKEVKNSVFELYSEFFCGMECLGDWRSENWSGEDHPFWKGGEIADYGGKWPSVRKKARRRDDYKCVICGKKREDMGYGPEVHHIIPVREHENPQNAHRIENVVSLCDVCHPNAEHGNIEVETLRNKI